MSVNIDLKDQNWSGVNKIRVPLQGGGTQDFSIGGGSANLQTKSATYTPTSSQQTAQIIPDNGYDGLDQVNITVNAVPSGSVTAPSSIDVSGATVLAPQSGTYLTVQKSNVSVTPNVTQAGYISSGTAGDSTVTVQTNIPTKQATTYYPSTTNQTIPVGTFCMGLQTFKAVTTTNLTAENIKSGVTVEIGDSADPDRVASVIGTYSAGGSTLTPYAIRPDATLVQSYTYDKYMVADEELTIPAYSTSAQVLKASASLGTITLDRDNYNYYVLVRMLTIPTYSITTAAKGRAEYQIGSHLYEIVDIPASSMHSLLDPTKYYTTRLNYASTAQSIYRLVYYSSGTTIATYSTQGYGAYQGVVAPSVSSGVLTINSPTVGMRGSTSYFTSTYFDAVTDIRAQYVIEVYKAPKNNLNIDGWGNDQQIKHIIDCVNSNTQTLT